MTEFHAYEKKPDETLVSFFYDIFEFFDFRKNKETNSLLYYFLFILLLRNDS